MNGNFQDGKQGTRKKKEQGPWGGPAIPARLGIFTRSGIFYVTCLRCNGKPVGGRYGRGTRLFHQPVTFVDEERGRWGVFDYSGGILPVYGEKRETAYACSCAVGVFMAQRFDLPEYERL